MLTDPFFEAETLGEHLKLKISSFMFVDILEFKLLLRVILSLNCHNNIKTRKNSLNIYNYSLLKEVTKISYLTFMPHCLKK